MKTFQLFVLLFSSAIISCNTIPKEEISVIENLTLGNSTDSLYKQMKSKSIPLDRFTSQYLVLDKSQLSDDKNFINVYYTNLFNTFSNQSQEHIGILYPNTLSGTHNVIGIIVILGHTKKPVLIGETKNYEYLNDSKFIKQMINEKLVEQIKEMYISKYGTPKSDNSSDYNNIYSINDGKIETKTSETISAKTYTWETKYLTITFFTGLKNYFEGCYYKPKDKFYMDLNFTNIPVDYANHMDCLAYPYIKYVLKDNAITELKLKSSNF